MDRNTRDEDVEMIAMLEKVLRLEKERELRQDVERQRQQAQFSISKKSGDQENLKSGHGASWR